MGEEGAPLEGNRVISVKTRIGISHGDGSDSGAGAVAVGRIFYAGAHGLLRPWRRVTGFAKLVRRPGLILFARRVGGSLRVFKSSLAR